MADKGIDKKKVLATLDRILEAELAGVVRYTHYSFMIFGYRRIPIISLFESQANEPRLHELWNVVAPLRIDKVRSIAGRHEPGCAGCRVEA